MPERSSILDFILSSLNKQHEPGFANQALGMPNVRDSLNYDRPGNDYDLMGYYKFGMRDPSGNGHLTDAFKRPTNEGSFY